MTTLSGRSIRNTARASPSGSACATAIACSASVPRRLGLHHQPPPASIGRKLQLGPELLESRARIGDFLDQREAARLAGAEIAHGDRVAEGLPDAHHAGQFAADVEARVKEAHGDKRKRGGGEDHGEDLVGRGLRGVDAERARHQQRSGSHAPGGGNAAVVPEDRAGDPAQQPIGRAPHAGLTQGRRCP
jgi:hypothetical protein